MRRDPQYPQPFRSSSRNAAAASSGGGGRSFTRLLTAAPRASAAPPGRAGGPSALDPARQLAPGHARRGRGLIPPGLLDVSRLAHLRPGSNRAAVSVRVMNLETLLRGEAALDAVRARHRLRADGDATAGT